MRRFLSITAIAGALFLGSVGPGAAAPKPKPFSEAEFGAASDAYQASHPHDWTGLSRVWRANGVEMLSVTDPLYGVANASPAVADAQTQSASGAISPLALSASDYSVAGSIGRITSTGEYVVQGNWNFRNDFINGSDPDDIALLSVRSNCYRIRGTYFSIYDYQGTSYNSLGYMKRAETDGDIAIGIDDRTSAFRLLNDNGNVRHFMRSKGSCYTRDFTAAFSYEHNQDGGSILGFSLSLGVISVSYSTGVKSFEKSTGLFY